MAAIGARELVTELPSPTVDRPWSDHRSARGRSGGDDAVPGSDSTPTTCAQASALIGPGHQRGLAQPRVGTAPRAHVIYA